MQFANWRLHFTHYNTFVQVRGDAAAMTSALHNPDVLANDRRDPSATALASH